MVRHSTASRRTLDPLCSGPSRRTQFKYTARGILMPVRRANALVALRNGARREPNSKATTADLTMAWKPRAETRPSLRFDLSLQRAAEPFLGTGFNKDLHVAAAFGSAFTSLIRRAEGSAAPGGERSDTRESQHFMRRAVIGAGRAVGKGGPRGLQRDAGAGSSVGRGFCSRRLLYERHEIDRMPGTLGLGTAKREVDTRSGPMPRTTGSASGQRVYGASKRVDHMPVRCRISSGSVSADSSTERRARGAPEADGSGQRRRASCWRRRCELRQPLRGVRPTGRIFTHPNETVATQASRGEGSRSGVIDGGAEPTLERGQARGSLGGQVIATSGERCCARSGRTFRNRDHRVDALGIRWLESNVALSCTRRSVWNDGRGFVLGPK